MIPNLIALSEAMIDAEATSDRLVHLGRTESPESHKNQLKTAAHLPIGGQQPSTEHIGKIQTT